MSEEFDVLNSQLLKILENRKNFLYYNDDPELRKVNVRCKFIYSNPNNYLEFINVDIHISGENLVSIYITMQPLELKSSKIVSDYGVLLSTPCYIRSVPKTKLMLLVNDNGVSKIRKTIEYFEKMCDSK